MIKNKKSTRNIGKSIFKIFSLYTIISLFVFGPKLHFWFFFIKRPKKYFFGCLGALKGLILHLHHKHLVTATKYENFTFVPGSVNVTKFGVFRFYNKKMTDSYSACDKA